MADTKTYTTNYNLVKPGQDDFYNIADFNANADKMDTALYTHKTASPLDHPDNSVTDAKIGTRTITDTVTASAEAGTLTNLLSKLGNMIKSITGKANWYTAPATTLEALFDLIVAVPGANKLLKLDANGKLPADITGDANTVNGKHANDFAPAGYGLGTTATQLANVDLNAINACGFYRITDTCTNRPFNWGFMIVMTIGGELIQVAWDVVYGTQFSRQKRAYTETFTDWVAIIKNDDPRLSDARPANGGTATNADFVNNDNGYMRFHWHGLVGQPPGLWGGTDGKNMYVYDPANFHVAEADTVDGKHASDFAPARYGVGESAVNITGTDLNALKGNGFFMGYNMTNSPNGSGWISVISISNGGDILTQYAHDNYNSQNAYIRISVDFGATWSAWKRLATTDQIPIADDLARRFCGRNTPVMTPLIDWSTMAAKVGVPSVKNLNHTGTGISAYGGDNKGNLGNGDIYLKQSYKNFDAILVVGCNDPTDFLMTYKWEKWGT